MFKKSLIILSALLSTAVPLFSVVYQTIDTEKLIHCTMSSLHQNRIAIVGGIVGKMMIPDGDVNFVLEETSGQIFVYPLVDYPPVTTLSIVMDDGTVQDIEIDFDARSSETLVLRYPVTKIETACDKKNCSVHAHNKEEAFSRIVNEILNGKISSEYTSCDYPKISKKVKKGVEATLSGKLIKDGEVVYIWNVKNKSTRPKSICESDFCEPGTQWVYVDQRCLKRDGETLVIVVVKL